MDDAALEAGNRLAIERLMQERDAARAALTEAQAENERLREVLSRIAHRMPTPHLVAMDALVQSAAREASDGR